MELTWRSEDPIVAAHVFGAGGVRGIGHVGRSPVAKESKRVRMVANAT